jgi:hypothetical protein
MHGCAAAQRFPRTVRADIARHHTTMPAVNIGIPVRNTNVRCRVPAVEPDTSCALAVQLWMSIGGIHVNGAAPCTT